MDKKMLRSFTSLMCSILIISACSFIPKPYSIKSPILSEEFPQVYCEDDFNFRNAGERTGTFTLPLNVSKARLSVSIFLPATYYSMKRSADWSGEVSIVSKVLFTWNGGSLETKLYNEKTSDPFLSFVSIEQLPRNKKINYKLQFEAGVYSQLKKLTTPDEGDHTANIMADPDDEKYKTLWNAKFVVIELPKKGL